MRLRCPVPTPFAAQATTAARTTPPQCLWQTSRPVGRPSLPPHSLGPHVVADMPGLDPALHTTVGSTQRTTAGWSGLPCARYLLPDEDNRLLLDPGVVDLLTLLVQPLLSARVCSPPPHRHPPPLPHARTGSLPPSRALSWHSPPLHAHCYPQLLLCAPCEQIQSPLHAGPRHRVGLHGGRTRHGCPANPYDNDALHGSD
jgi:hypothetical protein